MRYFKSFLLGLVILVMLILVLLGRSVPPPPTAPAVAHPHPAALPMVAKQAAAGTLNPALVDEAVDRSRAEQEDLRSRKQDLDAQLTDSATLIAAQKARIAALQKQLQEQQGAR